MSEFYTMPITTAKTNSSYVVPTSTQGSLFSFHHSNTSHTEAGHKSGKSFGKKISKFFSRDSNKI